MSFPQLVESMHIFSPTNYKLKFPHYYKCHLGKKIYKSRGGGGQKYKFLIWYTPPLIFGGGGGGTPALVKEKTFFMFVFP